MTDFISFTCVFCRKKLSAKHTHAGRVTNCPSCQRSVTVPHPTPAPLPAVTIADGPVARTPENTDRTRHRSPASSASQAKGDAAIHQNNNETSADPKLQNPVSVLLNSLVIDCLTERQKKVSQNALSEAEFNDFAKALLFQLQGAISHLETSGLRLPSERNTGTPGVPSPKKLEHPSTKSSQTIGAASLYPARGITAPAGPEDRRRLSAEMRARDIATAPPSLPPVSPQTSGSGGMAKIAGAALLGGAFGYLIGSRPTPGVGHVTHSGHGFFPTESDRADEFDPRHSQASYVSETDGPSSDGHADHSRVIGFDSSGDGVPDHFVVDTDGDGNADALAHDANSDGLIDSFEMDNDNDGRFDQRFVAAPFSSSPDNAFAASPKDGLDSAELGEDDQFVDEDSDHADEDMPLLEEDVGTDEEYASDESDDAEFDSETDFDADDDVSDFEDSSGDWE